jgi:hypothetical protein
MRTNIQWALFDRLYRILSIAVTSILMSCASSVHAQIFQAYTFEPDLQGFVGNADNPSWVTVSLETSGLGATVGPNSMKVAIADVGGFVGAQTENLHSVFTDGQGLDAIRFDLTNTNRYVPPMPVPGQTPTFANTSVTFFGAFASAPETDAQIQFDLSEEAIGTLEPGTHEIEIDVTQAGLQVLPEAPGAGERKSYTEWVQDGFIPFSWQIYFNKNVRFGGGPTWAWTVYVDNIRLVRAVEGVPGDYNGDGTVDAADYVAWRKDPATFGGDPGYDTWVQNYGNPSVGSGGGGAVPEPATAMLLTAAGVCWSGTTRRRAEVYRAYTDVCCRSHV